MSGNKEKAEKKRKRLRQLELKKPFSSIYGGGC
ncbi:DUF6366 family protein [Bacillus mojavensis]|nr:DUF6366 family protein [Bacillus mojavensis]